VGFWYTNREAVAGARKVLLMTHIAGYGLLASILVLYHRTGSALLTDPSVAHHFTTGIFLLMLVALVAKSHALSQEEATPPIYLRRRIPEIRAGCTCARPRLRICRRCAGW
jgi:hypothetical protein